MMKYDLLNYEYTYDVNDNWKIKWGSKIYSQNDEILHVALLILWWRQW